MPTVCAGWSVKDVALHILGGDLGNISRRRDGFQWTDVKPGEDIVTFVNRINEEWVQIARRLSTRVLIDLSSLLRPRIVRLFRHARSLGHRWQCKLGGPGPCASLAGCRERVHRTLAAPTAHQGGVRQARPDRSLLHGARGGHLCLCPSRAFHDTNAPDGTVVHLHIEGEAGGDWSLVKKTGGWKLYSGAAESPDALVRLDQTLAWRLLTKGILPEDAKPQIEFTGDERLGLPVLRAVAIIA